MASESFPPQSLGEVGFENCAGLAIREALKVLSDLIVRSGPIGVKAVILVVELDGLSVALDGLLVLLAAEGLIALLLPVLS